MMTWNITLDSDMVEIDSSKIQFMASSIYALIMVSANTSTE